MDMTHQLTTVFCEIDDFCKELDKYAQHHLLPGKIKGWRGPACSLAISEIMTILVMFQMVRFRDFKIFDEGFLQPYWRSYFPRLPGYHHFISLIKRAIFHMTLFTQIRKTNRYLLY
jgi:hypothetical protein